MEFTIGGLEAILAFAILRSAEEWFSYVLGALFIVFAVSAFVTGVRQLRQSERISQLASDEALIASAIYDYALQNEGNFPGFITRSRVSTAEASKSESKPEPEDDEAPKQTLADLRAARKAPSATD